MMIHNERVDEGCAPVRPGMRAAFYARVSSEQQSAAGTIDSQVAMLRERIAQDGLKLEPEMCFVDDGYSGTTLVRPGLERLRDASVSGVIDRVYVSCPDRLARKCSLQMVLVEELERCGVELVFLNRAIGKTPEDELLLQVQGVVAEYERAKILERSRRGKLHAARHGNVSAMGKAPYGYRYVPRGETGEALFNVHLEEARVVRQIFHWVGVERLSLRQVCRNLEKQGVLSAKGSSRWSASSLSVMLRNPAYKGLAGYGKRCSGAMRPRLRPHRGGLEQPRRPRGWYAMPADQWVLIPVPVIVEEELFCAVGEQMEENRRRARQWRTGSRYLLQGLLVCSRCRYAYCGYQRRSTRVTLQNGRTSYQYGYYRCNSSLGAYARRAGGGCACCNGELRVDHLEAAVWADVRSLLEDPARLEREFSRRLNGTDEDDESLERRRAATAAATLRRGMARLIDAYQGGLLEKGEFEPRMTATRARLAKLESELKSQADAESAAREMRLVIDNLQTFAERVKSGLGEADWTTRRELIRMLVKRIEIEKEQVRLVYKMDIRPFERGPERGFSKDCTLRRRATRRKRGWQGSEEAARGADPDYRPFRNIMVLIIPHRGTMSYNELVSLPW